MSLRQKWMFVNRTKAFVNQLRDQYGDFVVFTIAGDPFVILLSSRAVRDVLSTDPLRLDAFFKESFIGLTGPRSLWVLGGEAHRRERDLAAPPFHPRSFRRFGAEIRAATRRHTDRWQPGQTVRSLDTTLAISLDVVMRLVFGPDESGRLNEARSILSTLLRSVHPLTIFFPTLQTEWFPSWRRYARAKRQFRKWLDGYLAMRRAEGGAADDLAGRLLAARDPDGTPRPDAATCDQLITVLTAGHETTATALAWALYELGRHPAVREQLLRELQTLDEDADSAQFVTLPLLSAVCNETMRVHTLLTDAPRMCVAPVDCLEYTFPSGYALSASIVSIHHDPALYAEPDAFRPARFLERSYGPFEFLPFGGGDRRCLGAALSDFEMRIALADIVRRWDFEPARVDRDIRHDIATGPRHGIPLRIKARRTS